MVIIISRNFLNSFFGYCNSSNLVFTFGSNLGHYSKCCFFLLFKTHSGKERLTRFKAVIPRFAPRSTCHKPHTRLWSMQSAFKCNFKCYITTRPMWNYVVLRSEMLNPSVSLKGLINIAHTLWSLLTQKNSYFAIEWIFKS